MAERESVATQIRQARGTRSLTRAGLAERVGVTAADITAFEHGTRLPDSATLARIAAVLALDTAPLLAVLRRRTPPTPQREAQALTQATRRQRRNPHTRLALRLRMAWGRSRRREDTPWLHRRSRSTSRPGPHFNLRQPSHSSLMDDAFCSLSLVNSIQFYLRRSRALRNSLFRVPESLNCSRGAGERGRIHVVSGFRCERQTDEKAGLTWS